MTSEYTINLPNGLFYTWSLRWMFYGEFVSGVGEEREWGVLYPASENVNHWMPTGRVREPIKTDLEKILK